MLLLLITDADASSVPHHSLLFGKEFSSDMEGDGPTTRSAKPTRAACPTSKIIEANEAAAAAAKKKKDKRPPAAQRRNSETQFVVEDVVDLRVTGTGGLQLAVKWAGYPLEGPDKWQPAESFIPQAPEMVAALLLTRDKPAVPHISSRPISGMEVVRGRLMFYQEGLKKAFSAGEMCIQQPQLVAYYLRSGDLNPPPPNRRSCSQRHPSG